MFSRILRIRILRNISRNTKGQLISKCPFGFIVWTKISTKLYLDFCPEFFCSFLGASWKLFGLPGDLVCNIINKEACRKPQKASRKPPGRYKKFQGRNSEIIDNFVKTMKPKGHFEINWPLHTVKNIQSTQYIYLFLSEINRAIVLEQISCKIGINSEF